MGAPYGRRSKPTTVAICNPVPVSHRKIDNHQMRHGIGRAKQSCRSGQANPSGTIQRVGLDRALGQNGSRWRTWRWSRRTTRRRDCDSHNLSWRFAGRPAYGRPWGKIGLTTNAATSRPPQPAAPFSPLGSLFFALTGTNASITFQATAR